MSTGEPTADTTRQHLSTVVVLLLASMVLLAAVASVPIVDSASAGTGDDPDHVSDGDGSTSVSPLGGNNSTNATAAAGVDSATDGNDSGTADGGDVFESFTVDIDSGNPERPNDVEIKWNLSADADVERVRIEITNESDSPINVYKPNGTDVPNPFDVSDEAAQRTDADVVVDDLAAVELVLKIPPGHCDRVDEIEVFASTSSDGALGEPDIQRSQNCTSPSSTSSNSTSPNGTFAVAIADYDGEVTAGKTGSVTAEIENTGGARDTQDVQLLVDGEVYERTNLSLSANESQTLNFSYPTTESDVGELNLAVESDDDAANRTVIVTEPAFFAVTITEAPDAVAAGEPIAVTARVRNAGDHNETQDVTLRNFSGGVVDTTHGLELAPNESSTVTLTWSTDGDDVGVGNVTVGSENDTATAVVEITQPAVESIAVTLGDSELNTTENTSVTVEAAYTDGSMRIVTDNATLASQNTTVATVTASATVIAESEGEAVIEATYGGETDTETLIVDSVDTDDSASDSDDSGSDTPNDSSEKDTLSDDGTTTGDSGADTAASDETDDSADPASNESDGDEDDSGSDGDDSEAPDDSPDDEETTADDPAVESAETGDVADSATEERDRTTIAFFPILGLLLIPALVFAVRDSVWGS